MANVIMVTVIIEATTANAPIITPDLHTANPAATTTANPKLEKIIPPMVIPRSFPR